MIIRTTLSMFIHELTKFAPNIDPSHRDMLINLFAKIHGASTDDSVELYAQHLLQFKDDWFMTQLLIWTSMHAFEIIQYDSSTNEMQIRELINMTTFNPLDLFKDVPN